MSAVSFNPQQRDAVESEGESLMVSAAAGSGKTAVLAARCARLVAEPARNPAACDDGPCGVEQLLVVTFTNAAARQMRDRIGAALRKRAEMAEGDGDAALATRLSREIQLLPRASISTLSSFCVGVLRRHFHAAGVDPNFAILDADQANLLKKQAAKEVFEERYDPEDGGESAAFHELIDLYAEGDDRSLVQRVINCHELLTSVADPAAWRADALRDAEDAATKSLSESAAGEAILAHVRAEMASLAGAAKNALAVTKEHFADSPKLAKIAGYCEELVAHARLRYKVARDGDLDALARLAADFADPGLPRGARNDWPGYPECRDAVNALREAMSKGESADLVKLAQGDWRGGMAAVVGPTRLFLALVEAFGRKYAAAKSAMRALDFADLERKTLDLLADEDGGASEVARYYQRQYRHVLVDEFQDINEVQDRLIRLLSREAWPADDAEKPRPNLFAVGDVKQSIYRFRLAEPAQFLRRLEEAKNGEADHRRRIDLNTNYRSRAKLLGSVNVAFDRLLSDSQTLEIDYADNHRLAANPDYGDVPPGGFAGGPVEIHVLKSRQEVGGVAAESEAADEDEAGGGAGEAERVEREAALVAERIRQMKAEGRTVAVEGGGCEPLDFGHVAVLMRGFKRQSEKFAGALRRLGVPCHAAAGVGFFEAGEVRDVLALLRVLDNRRQDIPLAALLRSPLLDLHRPEDAMVRARLATRDAPFFEATLRHARDDDASLRAALDRIDRWRTLAHRRPLAELLWGVYQDSGYLTYVAGLVDGEQRVANLLELHRRAGQFDAFQRRGLGAFVAFLKSLEDAGEVGQPPAVSAGENVVRAMSVHASKGLEFPVVFLCDCGKAHNLRDASHKILLDRRAGVAMRAVDEGRRVHYATLGHELAKREAKRASLAEELRVMYVAMTRAREHLVCVGTVAHSCKDAAGEVERWRRSWGTVDRVPPRDVLGGKSFLDWLGMACAADLDGGEHFDVRVVEEDAIYESAERVSGRVKAAEVEARLRRMEPLDEPATSDAASAALDRVTRPYAHADAAARPAAVGVTSLQPLRRTSAPKRLARPSFFDANVTAADVGTATHDVLRHLDFRDAADESAVRRQVEAMVDVRRIDARLAKKIDVASIAWLAGTELGELLRKHYDALLRELPVRVPGDGGGDDPLDRTLLRGQIDVVIPLKAGLVLADYKTGGRSGSAEQVGRYRAALAVVAPERPVVAAYLVLLAARRLERL